MLLYFGKRKQTYHLNLSYWCFRILPCVLFFQAKLYASTIQHSTFILIFHRRQWKWQTHFALLQEMSLLSLASFCQSGAVCSFLSPNPLYRGKTFLSKGLGNEDKVITQGHSCRCQQIQARDLTYEGLWSYHWAKTAPHIKGIVWQCLHFKQSELHGPTCYQCLGPLGYGVIWKAWLLKVNLNNHCQMLKGWNTFDIHNVTRKREILVLTWWCNILTDILCDWHFTPKS